MFFKKPIIKQIEKYCSFRSSLGFREVEREAMWLQRFAKITGVHDVNDVTQHDLDVFRKHMSDIRATQYMEKVALRALRTFLKHYAALGYPCPRFTCAQMA